MVCASSKYELGIRFRMFGVDVRDTRSAVWSGCAPALGEMSPAESLRKVGSSFGRLINRSV